MAARWNGRATAYLVLAFVGLIGTWTFNVFAIAAHRDYLGDWIGSGPAVLSLTIDVLVAATASAVFMVIESRRIAMRRVWVYIALIPLVALAFALPLFLAMLERHLAGRGMEGDISEAGAASSELSLWITPLKNPRNR